MQAGVHSSRLMPLETLPYGLITPWEAIWL